jgi:hypothetical protein
MELNDLVGLHELSGVDMNDEKAKGEWGDSYEDCQVINFVLDGQTYAAIEDPEDGYRSCMKEIIQSSAVVTNVFPPIKVFASLSTEHDDDLLEFIDIQTGKVVLMVGTEDYNDYYPTFIASFWPENMSLNADIGQGKMLEAHDDAR